MTTIQDRLTEALVDMGPRGITGDGGPYCVVESGGDWDPNRVENAAGEWACRAEDATQAEQLARVLNLAPAMARALLAVLELHHRDEFGECAVCLGGDENGYAYPCPTVQAITAEFPEVAG